MSEPSFGDTLARLRRQRGLSQSMLARRIGCAHATVSRWELGIRAPARADVGQLARALQVDPVEAADLLIAAGYWPGCNAAAAYLESRGA